MKTKFQYRSLMKFQKEKIKTRFRKLAEIFISLLYASVILRVDTPRLNDDLVEKRLLEMCRQKLIKIHCET